MANGENPEQEKTQHLEKQITLSEEQLKIEEKIKDIRNEITQNQNEYLSQSEKLEQIRNREIEFLDKQKKLHQQNVKELQGYLSTYLKKEEFLEDINEELKEQKEIQEETAEAIRELKKEEEDINEELKEQKEIQEETAEAIRKLKDQKEFIKSLDEEHKESLEDELQKELEILNTLDEKQEKRREAARLQEKGAQAAESFANALGIGDFSETFMGSLLEATEDGQIEEALTGWKARMSEMITPANLMIATLEKVAEMTLLWTVTAHEAESSFMQATGAGEQWGQTIENTADIGYNYAFSIGEIEGAMTTLYNEFGLFNQLSKETQRDYAMHTAGMEKLGASASAVAENLDFLTKGFGMTADEAMATQREILAFGRAIGKGSRLVDEFAESMDVLARYGAEQAKEIFKDLAEQSQETGVEIQGLLDTVGQFDTFEGAAEASGRLNAMLGNDLINSVDMLRMNEAERIETLRNSVRASGQAWGSMNRYRKMAIASAVGINDMSKAERLFGENAAENQKKLEERMKTQKALNEAARETEPLWNRLKAVAFTLAVSLEPILEIIEWLVDWFLYLNKGLEDITENVSGFRVSIGHLFVAFMLITKGAGLLSGAFSLIGSALTTLAGLIPGASAGMVGLGESVGKAGKSMAKGSKGFLAFAGAIAMVSAGIAAAAMGIGYLVSQFGELDPKQLEAANNALIGFATTLVIMAAAIVAVGAASTVSAPGMLAFGGAMLMIGAGVGLAAAGLSLVVGEMVRLVEVAGGGELLGVAAAIISLSSSILGLAFAAPFLPTIVLGLYGLSYALAGIPIKETEKLNDLFKTFAMDGLSSKISNVASSLWELAPAISKLVSEIQKIPESKMMAFQTTLDSFGRVAAQARQLKNEHIERIERFLKSSKEYHNIIKEQQSAGLDVDALAKAVSKAVGTTTTTTGEGGGAAKSELNINIDGRTLRKYIIEVVGKEFSMDRKY